jgi:hypothetical protein
LLLTLAASASPGIKACAETLLAQASGGNERFPGGVEHVPPAGGGAGISPPAAPAARPLAIPSPTEPPEVTPDASQAAPEEPTQDTAPTPHEKPGDTSAEKNRDDVRP